MGRALDLSRPTSPPGRAGSVHVAGSSWRGGCGGPGPGRRRQTVPASAARRAVRTGRSARFEGRAPGCGAAGAGAAAAAPDLARRRK